MAAKNQIFERYCTEYAQANRARKSEILNLACMKFGVPANLTEGFAH